MKHSIIAAGLLLAACTTALESAPQHAAPADLPADLPASLQRANIDLGQPYLGGPLPGALSLVLPPPADGSTRLLRDLEVNEAALGGHGGPRWNLATRDASLAPGWVGNAFSCTAGLTISDAATPRLAALLRRAASDFAMSTNEVKDHYQRRRPFLANGAASCTPEQETVLAANGSYPSGHAALGFGTGLVLASLLPDRAAGLVRRGTDFGTSRAMCNVHWHSDVEAGQQIAAAVYARLQSDPSFRADLEAARAELALPRADSGTAQSPQCIAEAEALGNLPVSPR